MNNSGQIFSENPDFLPNAERRLLVFCDQMDLAPGVVRLKTRGSSAGHNGLKSINSYIGDDFIPLYIGIGRPRPGSDVITHVLGEPDLSDDQLINEALKRCIAGLEMLFSQNIDSAMSFLNQRLPDAGKVLPKN